MRHEYEVKFKVFGKGFKSRVFAKNEDEAKALISTLIKEKTEFVSFGAKDPVMADRAKVISEYEEFLNAVFGRLK